MYRIPDIFTWLPAPLLIFRMKHCDNNSVFITFDDGPDPGSTFEILKTLDMLDVKASFFLSGKNAEAYPEIVEQIRIKQHAVHLHGYDHSKFRNYTRDSLFRSLDKCYDLLKSRYIRPPYGRIPLKYVLSLKRNGFRIIMWNVDPQDYNKDEINPGKLLSLIRKIRKGDIILLHDKPQNLDKTHTLISHITTCLKDKGFTFSTIV